MLPTDWEVSPDSHPVGTNMFDQIRFEKLLFEGPAHFESVLSEIDRAQGEILVSTYILKPDQIGERVCQQLLRQVSRGVVVKLIVDGYGSAAWIRQCADLYSVKGLDIRIFHPIPWPVSKLLLSEVPRLDRLVNFLSHSNRRNHQKFFVFDRKRGIVGSRNIHNDANIWRETSLFVQDERVPSLGEVFDHLWEGSHSLHFQKQAPQKDVRQSFSLRRGFFSNHSHSLRNQKKEQILSRLRNARHRIAITTPYFFPPAAVFKVLCEKARAGVQVDLLLPRGTDVLLSKWIARLHYRSLLEAGVQIYEYAPAVLHAKQLVVDDWALVGSSNFNRRSFVRDLEIDYNLLDQSSVRDLCSRFEEDLERATLIREAPAKQFLVFIIARFVMKIFPSWL